MLHEANPYMLHTPETHAIAPVRALARSAAGPHPRPPHDGGRFRHRDKMLSERVRCGSRGWCSLLRVLLRPCLLTSHRNSKSGCHASACHRRRGRAHVRVDLAHFRRQLKGRRVLVSAQLTCLQASQAHVSGCMRLVRGMVAARRAPGSTVASRSVSFSCCGWCC